MSRMFERTVSPKLRFAVFNRDDFKCQYCGRRAPDVVLHADHVIPFSQGGTTHKANLKTACQDCNLGKGTMRLETGAELFDAEFTDMESFLTCDPAVFDMALLVI